MNNNFKKTIALCLISLSTFACTAKASPTSAEEWATVQAAYNYCLPLVMMNATKEKMTNVETAMGSQAPVNQLAHAKNLANASSLNVVTPNTDTLYTQVFLDLSDTAMVLVKPQVERYVSIQVMDAYTNTVQVLGTGGDTQAERSYLFTGPDFKGEIPSDLHQISLAQNMSWILIRTLCQGLDDLNHVADIQNQFKLLPLDYYLSGKPYTPPAGSYDKTLDYIPVKQVLQMTPKQFFDKANSLMLENPPTLEDPDIMERMAAIEVGPGKTFQADVLGKDSQEKWKDMILNLEDNLSKECREFRVAKGQWRYLGKPIAEFGEEYTYRALVSLGGLGANPVSAAIYLRGDKDEQDKQLNGSQSYHIHFEKDQLPKTREHGFWSITAYNSANFLIDNPLDRYDINDRDALKFNEDGSLDIIVQEQAPTDSTMTSNWLPVSNEDFHLYLRIYLPHEDVIDGSWQAPTIIQQ